MKTLLAIVSAFIIATGPVSFAQEKSASSGKSGGKDAQVIELERATWETFKNKQTEPYKKYLAPDYRAITDEGVRMADQDVAAIATTDLRSYSLSDWKVTFPQSDVAVITYKAELNETSKGKDVSGTYHCASVWVKQGGKWLTTLYSEVKATAASP